MNVNTKKNSLASRASGVVSADALLANSHLPSLPATDHGRGFGGSTGVRLSPAFRLNIRSASTLLIDSLLGVRAFLLLNILDETRTRCCCSTLLLVATVAVVTLPMSEALVFVCALSSGDFWLTAAGEYFSRWSDEIERGVQATPFSSGEL